MGDILVAHPGELAEFDHSSRTGSSGAGIQGVVKGDEILVRSGAAWSPS